MQPIRTILHPTDFSERSEAALDLALALARDRDARLVVLHVAPDDVLPSGPACVPADHRFYRGRLKDIRRRGGAGLESPMDVELRRGEPVEEILSAADDLGADLIVMGTHGRSGLGRLLMGSVAEGVLRSANCAVLTLRAPSQAVVPSSPGAAAPAST